MEIVNTELQIKSMVGILTLDVKNAFNSALWNGIATALRSKGVPGYLCRLLDDYFDGRILVYETSRVTTTRQLAAGVPQGLVLGPTLWNFLYNGLLRLPTPNGIQLVAYADDIAIVARGAVTYIVGELIEETAETVIDWLSAIGIELALEKTELLIPTRKRKHNSLDVRIKGHLISPRSSIKYLGIHIDQRVNFGTHARTVAQKADKATCWLRAIIPNIEGPRYQARRLLAAVPHSMLLYGAPIWDRTMSVVGRKAMEKCQRRIALRVAMAYHTISTDALLVLAGIPPIDLLAVERTEIHDGKKVGRAAAELSTEAR